MGNNMHHKFNGKRFAKGFLFGIIFLAFFSLIVSLLWNWIMPSLFGLKAIGYFQAAGLLILSKILFSGFGKRGGPPHFKSREYWKKRFEEQEKSMDETVGGEKV